MTSQSSTSTKPLAVVTGASSGIGFALAAELARRGFDLVICAGSDRLETARSKLTEDGTKVDAVRADLASYDGVELLYAHLHKMGRPVDTLVLNAGIGVSGTFPETALRDELNLIQLNVVSVVHLAKRVIPDMIARGHGRILITSSIGAVVPTPFQAVYGASKAFELAFAEALRSELKDKGVVVTALMPGVTDTDFFRRAGMDDTKMAARKEKENAPEDVARQGIDALMAGKDHIVAASLKTKLEGFLARFLPEPAKAAMNRKLAKPGGADKEKRKSA